MSRVERAGRQVISRVRSGRQARARRAPRLRAGPAPGGRGEPAIYYLCPDSDVPSGGIRQIYRHVDVLNSAGLRAAVVHRRPGFSCSWFSHQTATAAAQSVTLTPADAVVVPEFYAGSIGEMPPGPRLIVFNQNAYRTFNWARPSGRGTPCWDISRIDAMLVVSRDNEEYARYAFSGLPVHRIRNAVDGRVFHPPSAPPGRRIAVMPRRRPADSRQVLDLLTMRGCLDGWEIVSIDGSSEAQTAHALRSCSVFLSFSDQEGFGMPPAEAMACGCYVVGFTGLAGREFFDPAVSEPVEEGDVLAFARAAERALLAFGRQPQAMRQRALTASARILREYSPGGMSADLLAFFASPRDGAGSGGAGAAAGAGAHRA